MLRKRFPGTLLCHDVTSLPELPRETEMVAAGFPCTDLSIAGTKRGIYGPASGLWTHILRLIRRRRVPFVLLENVPGILLSYSGRPAGVATVAEEFERLGYNWAYRIIDAASFGVPGTRKRWFFVASMYVPHLIHLLTHTHRHFR